MFVLPSTLILPSFCKGIYYRLWRIDLLVEINPLKTRGPVVTIYTARFNIHQFPICPHSVFMCFVWISEQTAIISLYSNNWLVFITETECVYCAVRTEFWNIIHTTFQAQAVIRRPVTAEARVRSRSSTGGICGGHSVNGTDFSLSTSAFSCQCIVTNA